MSNIFPFPPPEERNQKPNEPPSEPMFNLPPLVKYLALVLIGFHVLYLVLPEDTAMVMRLWLAFGPGQVLREHFWSLIGWPSLLTHALLHGSLMHLGMNLGMLLAFGSPYERYAGKRRFLTVFLVSIIVGALAEWVMASHDQFLVLGASGGISGLFGAMLLQMYHHGGLPGGRKQLLLIIGVWSALNLVFAFGDLMAGFGIDNLAWAAHLGGFFAGIAIAAFFQKYEPTSKGY